MRDKIVGTQEPAVADKVAFLSRPEAYSHAVDELALRETHMSWVFLAGDKVYKLKKPVRFPYLDFSTLARREAACRAEFSLNRRLAPDIYLGVIPLNASPRGPVARRRGRRCRLAGRHAPARRSMGARGRSCARAGLEVSQLDRLIATLVRFYRRARPVLHSSGAHLAALAEKSDLEPPRSARSAL